MSVKQNRKRYILSKIHSTKEIKKELIESAIIESTKTLFGEIDSPKIKILDEFIKKGHFVIAVKNHTDVIKTKIGIAMVQKINNHAIILQSIKVFGTLKKIKQIFKEEL